jgi:putative phage-type endonuclease
MPKSKRALSQLLAEQATGVGGSESHHLFSLPPYGCRRQLWYKKSGVKEDFPFHGNKDTERGTHLEKIVADLYSKETGRFLKVCGVVRHPELPQMLAHPDRIITWKNPPAEGPGVLEIKCPTVRSFVRIKREGLPGNWLLQHQHTMAAAGASWGSFAVFSAELWELVHFDQTKDHTLEERIRQEISSFWGANPGSQLAPSRLDPSDPRCASCTYRTTCQGQALLDLKARAQADEGGELPVDDTLQPLVRDFLEADGLVKEATELRDERKDQLKTAVGDRLRVRTQDAKVYCGVQERRTLDAEGLRRDHPALAAQYERKSVCRSLRVYPT